MASRKSRYIYIPKHFYGGQKFHNYFSSLLIRGMSLLTCSYIGELRNDWKLKCEKKPFVVFILVLRRVLF